MGNAQNLLKDVSIGQAPVLRTDNWFLHHATNETDGTELAVFMSKPTDVDVVRLYGQNLKLYRHPNILRYVGACESDVGVTYLFTEKAFPLVSVLNRLSPLQIRLGLQDVLIGLKFLHEKGNACHNNISKQSILVSLDDRWKLGGMEFVKKMDLMSSSFLDDTRHLRYDGGISLEEKTGAAFHDHRARDLFSVGVLIEEVLTTMADVESDASAVSLLQLAKNQLQARDVTSRPSIDQVLSQNFFDEDFLKVVSFLSHLPVQSSDERATFFADIVRRLFLLPEKVVASQLSPLLLSRLVLLDQNAVISLVPSLLTPAEEERSFDPDKSCNPLVSASLYKEYVVPLLLKIFQVRDAQIRLLLLRHFAAYHQMFSKSQLEAEVLPQLLLGIRDTNDFLVAQTLRALAEIVPVLGASTVVGRNRLKVFSDGSPTKPKVHSSAPMSVPGSRLGDPSSEKSRPPIGNSPPTSMQRFSPIGAETSDDEKKYTGSRVVEDSFDAEWDDWNDGAEELTDKVDNDVKASGDAAAVQNVDDFFSGMEPNLAKPRTLFEIMQQNEQTEENSVPSQISKFSVLEQSETEEADGRGGWADDLDLNEIEETIN